MDKNTKESTLLNLPLHILLDLLLNLDIHTIFTFLLTSKFINSFNQASLWRRLLSRDYAYHLISSPLPDDNPAFSLSTLKYIYDSPEESALNYEPDYKPKLTSAQLLLVNDCLNKCINHANLYKDLYLNVKRPPIEGQWIGDYHAHGNETLKLLQVGYELWAIKLTGDPNIPAKKVTWKVTMKKDWSYGRGTIHLADTGYQNPRWGPAEILILGVDRIILCAYFQEGNSWLKISLCCKKMINGNETPSFGIFSINV